MLRKLTSKAANLRPVAVIAGLGLFLAGMLQRTTLTFWAWYWFTWFFIGFLPPELYWVFRNPANTLSDNTWRFESLDFKHPFDFAEWTVPHWSMAVVFTLLMTWLWLHLLFGELR